jgi:AcrR family transcriptional regulator
LNDLADGHRTRERLIAASIELFDRDGFTRTSLDAVCRRVRVTKGALYRHFPSKLALGAAVVEEHFRMSHDVRAAVEAVSPSPLQALIDMTYLMCRLACTDRTVRVSVRLLFTSELFDLLAGTYCVSVATMIRDLLRDAVEVGQVRPDVDVREEAEGLMMMIIGGQLRTVVSAGKSDVDGQLTMLWQRQVDRLVPAEQRDRLRTRPPPFDRVVD